MEIGFDGEFEGLIPKRGRYQIRVQAKVFVKRVEVRGMSEKSVDAFRKDGVGNQSSRIGFGRKGYDRKR